jgi:hypothetical protein
VRAVLEISLYVVGLIATLVLAALTAVKVLFAVGLSPILGLLALPVVLIGMFIGFHRAFDISLALFQRVALRQGDVRFSSKMPELTNIGTKHYTLAFAYGPRVKHVANSVPKEVESYHRQ